MQLMPATARELAQAESLPLVLDDLHQPATNIRLATRYLRQVLDMFDGDVELALAGYNAGPYRIRRWWNEAGSSRRVDHFIEGLPLEEPRVYVKRILLLSDAYRLRLEPSTTGTDGPDSTP
jgi:soluble lytic murein transglycosylase